MAQTKAMFPNPPAFPGRATPGPANRFSRDTSHEARITECTAVLFVMGAPCEEKSGAEGGGTKNRNPPPGPTRPLRSHGLPAHHWTRWDGFLVAHSGLPCRLFPTMACSLLPTIARHCPALLGKKIVPMSHSVHAPSAVLGGPQDDHRSPKLAAPSGLVLLLRTPNEPMLNMLRKGNVLY